MVRACDFFLERHLRVNHLSSFGAFDRHPFSQAGQLHLLRAAHHDHSVAQRFTAGFIQEWDISKEKLGELRCRFASVLHWRRIRGCRIRSSARFLVASPNTIARRWARFKSPSLEKDMAAKLGTNFSFHFRKLDKNVRCLVGIEEFRGGKHLAQTLAKLTYPWKSLR